MTAPKDMRAIANRYGYYGTVEECVECHTPVKRVNERWEHVIPASGDWAITAHHNAQPGSTLPVADMLSWHTLCARCGHAITGDATGHYSDVSCALDNCPGFVAVLPEGESPIVFGDTTLGQGGYGGQMFTNGASSQPVEEARNAVYHAYSDAHAGYVGNVTMPEFSGLLGALIEAVRAEDEVEMARRLVIDGQRIHKMYDKQLDELDRVKAQLALMIQWHPPTDAEQDRLDALGR